MIGDFALRNGELLPLSRALLPFDDAELLHGYGCYETLKVREGRLYFASLHADRLLSSAAILGIRHGLSREGLVEGLGRLVAANGLADCNLKLVLLGREGREAETLAFLLPALRPPEEAEAEGVDCLLFRGERPFPRAKSLGLLVSSLAFREASKRGCWDALLVNRREELTEGTRTNLFYFSIEGPFVLKTPPAEDCLPGITRLTLAEALAERGIPIREAPLGLAEAVSGGLSLFVTSTSSLLLPVRRLLGEEELSLPASSRIGELQAIYRDYLSRSSCL